MGLKVLLVEDEASLRTVMARSLVAAGHEVLFASDAEQAIGYLDKERGIGLIVLDMMLARGTTGWSVLDYRYHLPRVKAIPLAIVSGIPPEEILFKARENWLEGVSFLSGKPFEMKRLLAYIETLELTTPEPEP